MDQTRARDNNTNWKRGRSVASNGYVLIRVGVGHPLADVRGYAYEHRLVAFAKFGRMLRDDEHVHHRDGDKQNNDWDNIEVLTIAEHRSEHRAIDSNLRKLGEPNPTVSCGCGCGATFERYDATGRPRLFVAGHNQGLPVRSRILEHLSANGPTSARQIADAFRLDIRVVSRALCKMRHAGRVEQTERREWRAVNADAKSAGAAG